MTEIHPAVPSACPVCRSRKTQSTGLQNVVERLVLRILRIHTFWCDDCLRHFYLFFPKPELCRQESSGGNLR